MVLRTALEQVRKQLIDGIVTKPIGSTFTPMQLAVESYLDVDVDFHDSEHRILKMLAEGGHIENMLTAYVEPDSREHDVVHVNHFTADDRDNERGKWIQIDRDGTITKL